MSTETRPVDGPQFPECDSLPPRRRAICRGEVLSLSKCNTYRAAWGFAPLPWDVSKPSRGLGDTVAKITHATGIDKVVKTIAPAGCGCVGRQKKLNDLVPFAPSASE